MKNKWVAYFLLLSFPFFAAHRFYLGEWKKALLIILAVLLPFITADLISLFQIKIPYISQSGYMIFSIGLWLVLLLRELILIPKLVEKRNNVLTRETDASE